MEHIVEFLRSMDEPEMAEACAKVYLNTYDLTDIADDIRSGKWREYL